MNKLPDFSAFNVMVIGDIMLDQYIRGTISRISPEAPVPVLQWNDTVLKAGGAANVALNISSLGATPILTAVMGNDLSGAKLNQVLREEALDNSCILIDIERKTTVKTRLLSGAQHLLRIDEEDTHDLDPVNENDLKEQISKTLDERKVDAILIEDYNKGLLTSSLIEYICMEAKDRSIFVAVDPKFKNFGEYRNCALLKPNLREVNEWLKTNFSTSDEELREAAKLIRMRNGYKNLMITLGDEGIFIDDGKQMQKIEAKSLDIVDVCGAGDAVISMATLCLLSGLSLEESAKWSNIAGAHVCQHLGVTVVDRNTITSDPKL